MTTFPARVISRFSIVTTKIPVSAIMRLARISIILKAVSIQYKAVFLYETDSEWSSTVGICRKEIISMSGFPSACMPLKPCVHLCTPDLQLQPIANAVAGAKRG